MHRAAQTEILDLEDDIDEFRARFRLELGKRFSLSTLFLDGVLTASSFLLASSLSPDPETKPLPSDGWHPIVIHGGGSVVTRCLSRECVPYANETSIATNNALTDLNANFNNSSLTTTVFETFAAVVAVAMIFPVKKGIASVQVKIANQQYEDYVREAIEYKFAKEIQYPKGANFVGNLLAVCVNQRKFDFAARLYRVLYNGLPHINAFRIHSGELELASTSWWRFRVGPTFSFSQFPTECYRPPNKDDQENARKKFLQAVMGLKEKELIQLLNAVGSYPCDNLDSFVASENQEKGRENKEEIAETTQSLEAKDRERMLAIIYTHETDPVEILAILFHLDEATQQTFIGRSSAAAPLEDKKDDITSSESLQAALWILRECTKILEAKPSTQLAEFGKLFSKLTIQNGKYLKELRLALLFLFKGLKSAHDRKLKDAPQYQKVAGTMLAGAIYASRSVVATDNQKILFGILHKAITAYCPDEIEEDNIKTEASDILAKTSDPGASWLSSCCSRQYFDESVTKSKLSLFANSDVYNAWQQGTVKKQSENVGKLQEELKKRTPEEVNASSSSSYSSSSCSTSSCSSSSATPSI